MRWICVDGFLDGAGVGVKRGEFFFTEFIRVFLVYDKITCESRNTRLTKLD